MIFTGDQINPQFVVINIEYIILILFQLVTKNLKTLIIFTGD